MIIRPMTRDDLADTAKVHLEAFVRQRRSEEWLLCTFNAYPRMMLYVAEVEGVIEGYITWAQKSGFRPEAIIELEQLAVRPASQGKGIGKQLIKDSLKLVREELTAQGSTLKHAIVTTRADNHAQLIYREMLGAEVEATITNLYSADEVFMIARNL